MSLRRRLDRLEQQQRGREAGTTHRLTDAEWAEVFQRDQRELAPRDGAFAAAVAAYRQAVTDAQEQCGLGDRRRGELWCHFPTVADTWERCADFAQRVLEVACGETAG